MVLQLLPMPPSLPNAYRSLNEFKGIIVKRIAVLVKQSNANTCAAGSCFKSFWDRSAGFSQYGVDDIVLIALGHDGSDTENPAHVIEGRIRDFKALDVDVVHVSSCIRLLGESYYEALVETLGQHFDVVGHSHALKTPRKDLALIHMKSGIKTFAVDTDR